MQLGLDQTCDPWQTKLMQPTNFFLLIKLRNFGPLEVYWCLKHLCATCKYGKNKKLTLAIVVASKN